ncbi:unnamed protein product [Candidula unifasciata]|uniref:TIR domain-containing protein n=1 Tax=Candidula unifasciata TaxID=100452 RepID=A0A8S3YJN7_9EUPU|nr:unnamed protein product [Candidula unifasciata]
MLLMFIAASFCHQLVSSSSYTPPSWGGACHDTVTPLTTLSSVTSVYESTVLVDIKCYIGQAQLYQWKLNDLRDWTINNKINYQTTPSNRTVIYNITVTCANGANISLPWPMRVLGLVELHVFYCYVLDRYANMYDAIDATMPNEMTVLEIRHSIWVRNLTNTVVRDSDEGVNLTSHFDCGQDSTLQSMITSNNSVIIRNLDKNIDVTNLTGAELGGFTNLNMKLPENFAGATSNRLVKPEDRLIKDITKVVGEQTNNATESDSTQSSKGESNSEASIKEAQLENIKFLIKMMNTRTKCSFKKLKLIDESISPLTSVHHFVVMVQGSEYPVLENMNYSYLGLKDMPKQLAEWRIYFPKLRNLDLSHNYISEVKIPHYPSISNDFVVKFNLRHNNITMINMDLLNSWADVENFFLDIRDNPIHCGCEMASLLPFLENNSTFRDKLAPYEYVRHLYCATPEALAGHQLHTLTADSLSCPVLTSNKNVVIVLAIVMAILITLIIVIIRFKIEIRILLYTRLHVRLPCDIDSQESSKQFDAFISYSNDDSDWVCENLIKFLEKPPNDTSTSGVDLKKSKHTGNSQQSFKLCVHQRDFILGKSIFDNIVDCIEASRHTIIVLSPSFMRSHWAMEELRQAYRQSLVEKTRHLIVILLEKVPKEEMDPLISRCCKTFTYLEVDDTLFRDRLVFSLTTKDRSARRRDRLAARGDKIADTSVQKSEITLDDVVSDCGVYDNSGYFPLPARPPEPARELSNMSTSSTSALHPC